MNEIRQIKRILKPNHTQSELIRLMVDGLDWGDPRLPEGKAPGVPLNIEQAAHIAGVQQRYVRQIMAQPAMQAAFKTALANRRGTAAPRAIAALEAIVEAPVITPKPSDIIAAARTLLGEEATKGTTVNVAVQTNVATGDRPRAGYVIRLDRPRAQQTIDGHANDVTPSEPQT
jgi:hypothetical protein